MSTNKEIAHTIYHKHIDLASTDGRSFRKTVLEEMVAVMGCSWAAACTHYNNCKKAGPKIEGLGRPEVSDAVRKIPKGTASQQEVSEEECYTVMEVLENGTSATVGRTHSFEGLGLARIKLKEMIARAPARKWQLILGLGPLAGETYKLAEDEKILVEHIPE